MDCQTGKLFDYNYFLAEHGKESPKAQKLREEFDELKEHLAPVKNEDVKKVKRMSKVRRKNWMRNQPCPCGSGKKFKKCCWNKYS